VPLVSGEGLLPRIRIGVPRRRHARGVGRTNAETVGCRAETPGDQSRPSDAGPDVGSEVTLPEELLSAASGEFAQMPLPRHRRLMIDAAQTLRAADAELALLRAEVESLRAEVARLSGLARY